MEPLKEGAAKPAAAAAGAAGDDWPRSKLPRWPPAPAGDSPPPRPAAPPATPTVRFAEVPAETPAVSVFEPPAVAVSEPPAPPAPQAAQVMAGAPAPAAEAAGVAPPAAALPTETPPASPTAEPSPAAATPATPPAAPLSAAPPAASSPAVVPTTPTEGVAPGAPQPPLNAPPAAAAAPAAAPAAAAAAPAAAGPPSAAAADEPPVQLPSSSPSLAPPTPPAPAASASLAAAAAGAPAAAAAPPPSVHTLAALYRIWRRARPSGAAFASCAVLRELICRDPVARVVFKLPPEAGGADGAAGTAGSAVGGAAGGAASSGGTAFGGTASGGSGSAWVAAPRCSGTEVAAAGRQIARQLCRWVWQGAGAAPPPAALADPLPPDAATRKVLERVRKLELADAPRKAAGGGRHYSVPRRGRAPQQTPVDEIFVDFEKFAAAFADLFSATDAPPIRNDIAEQALNYGAKATVASFTLQEIARSGYLGVLKPYESCLHVCAAPAGAPPAAATEPPFVFHPQTPLAEGAHCAEAPAARLPAGGPCPCCGRRGGNSGTAPQNSFSLVRPAGLPLPDAALRDRGAAGGQLPAPPVDFLVREFETLQQRIADAAAARVREAEMFA